MADRYLKITLLDDTRFIIRVTRESPKLISGVQVDTRGDEIVPPGVDPEGRSYHQRVLHVPRTEIDRVVPMRMNNKYATLEIVPGSDTGPRPVTIVTDTATLAEAMYPGGGLAAFNEGTYEGREGTPVPIRKMTGREVVTVAGTTASSKVLSDETWVSDRFGKVGSRQIRRLRLLAKKEDRS